MTSRSRQTALKLWVALTLALPAAEAVADKALVISNFAYDGAEARRDVRTRAEDVSEMLFGLGYAVNRMENPSAAEMTAALDAMAGHVDPVVIYYAGRSIVEDTQTRLLAASGNGAVLLDDALTRAGASTRETTLVFLDVCLDPAPPTVSKDGAEVITQEESVPELPSSYAGVGALPAIGGLFVASPMPIGTACATTEPSLTEVMLERLLIPELETDLLFDGTSVAVASTLTDPFVFRNADSGIRLTAEDYRMLDNLSPQAQDQMLARWAEAGIAVDREGSDRVVTPGSMMVTTETVVLTSPVKPIRTGGATLAPITPTVSRVQNGVAPAPQAPAPTQVSSTRTRAVPGAGGLPRPSIIVGPLATTEASFASATEPTGPVTGSAIEYSDLEGRRALRDDNPELFATLVEGGAFDPPPAELVVALQTELQRMNCYNSGIDGAWGPGSRAAVGRYYEQLDSASPSQNADVSIFRQIMVRDDVTCPAVTRPAATTSRPATTQRATPRRTQPAQPQPAPQQPAAPSRTINRNSGTGIFR